MSSIIKYKLLFISLISIFITNHSIAGNWTESSYWSVWGKRDYKVYLPHNYKPNFKGHKLPVITAIHGCMQDSKSFAGGTRLNEWADKLGFAVYYPEQSSLFNTYNCWNWFFPVNQTRSMGEAQLIMGGLEKVIKQFNFDPAKSYLIGMSAGGAMASILAACYPKNFNALATHHGLMYKAATDSIRAKDIVYNGSKLAPATSAAKAHLCSLKAKKPELLPSIIIHGIPGEVMDSIHALQIEKEMMIFNDYLDNRKADNSLENIKTETYITNQDQYNYEQTEWSHQGKVYLKKILIEDLGHAWSGGDKIYKYNDPKGPDATKLILNFFKNYDLNHK